MLASADLAKITKQIQTIQAAQESGKSKRAGTASLVPSLVPAKTTKSAGLAKPSPKTITAASPSQIGTAIRAARTAANLSQVELSARIKTAQSNIVRLEKGRSQASTRTLHRIAEATGHKLVISFTRTS